MNSKSNLGGSRPGSGRPKGAQNRRTLALSEKLLNAGKCPAEALIRIAEQAEADGHTALAIDAWKAVLPYVHAKPKAVELNPDGVVELVREIAMARNQPISDENSSFGALLSRAEVRLTELGQADD